MTLSKKMILTPFVSAAMIFTLASSVSADRKKYTVPEIEKKLMQGCLDDDKNDQAQCECVFTGLKRDSSPKDYDAMMGFIGLTFNGNLMGIWDFIVNNDMTMAEIEKLGERIEKTTDKLEKECGGVEMNLKLNLGKSEQKI